MAKISNGLITALNVLTLLAALLAIGFSVYLHIRPESQCQRVIKTPVLFVGIGLLVVSLAGLVGSCCRITFVMWIYLIVLFLLILGLILFTAFAIVVTNKGVGKALSGQGVGSHRLGNYSKWLQRYVVNAGNWGKIKSCMIDAKLCQNDELYKHKLSLIQSGCCKPPNNCGGIQSPNNSTDCKSWSAAPKQLCFDCETCKAAVLGNIKRDWKLMAIINSCIVVFVIIVYSVGCCALRNNRSNGYKGQRQAA